MAAAKNNRGFSSLKKDISENKIGRLYLFEGEESYLKEYYLNLLSEKLIPKGNESFNLHIYDERSINPDSLLDSVESLPVMSDRKLVIIRDFDILKADSSIKPMLTDLFSDLPEYICLVFLYDTIEFKADSRQKIYKLLQENGSVCEFPLQENHDLIPWIKRRFSSLGRTISSSDAEYLIFLCGRSMVNLSGEISKIAAYSRSSSITRADIDDTAVPVPDAVIYELTDALSSRDFAKAHEAADRLLSMRIDSIALTSSIGRQVRQLYSACLCLKNGKGKQHLMDIWKFRSSYPAERLLKSASSLNLAWCRSAIRLCASADLKLKSSSVDKEQTVRLLLSQLSLNI